MRNIKYGLLVMLSIILFSVPVLAAQKTYYLPSKIVVDIGDSVDLYYKYSYDKYGHMTKLYESEDSDNTSWKFKYDKNGKRISGEQYYEGRVVAKLVFDKNDRLKTLTRGSVETETIKYKWNAKGYYEGDTGEFSVTTYKYYYYSDGKLKKKAEYYKGTISRVSYYDKSGLCSKTVNKYDGSTTTYKYQLDKNGLVSTIAKTTTDSSGKKTTRKTRVYYSKTKTDLKTYSMFIDGCRSCTNNGLI